VFTCTFNHGITPKNVYIFFSDAILVKFFQKGSFVDASHFQHGSRVSALFQFIGNENCFLESSNCCLGEGELKLTLAQVFEDMDEVSLDIVECPGEVSNQGCAGGVSSGSVSDSSSDSSSEMSSSLPDLLMPEKEAEVIVIPDTPVKDGVSPIVDLTLDSPELPSMKHARSKKRPIVDSETVASYSLPKVSKSDKMSTIDSAKRSIFEDSNPSYDPRPTLFRDRWPIFRKTSKPFSAFEAVEHCLEATCELLCASVPSNCQKNATFIIDLSKLKHSRDLTVDDNGIWQRPSGNKTFVKISKEQNGRVLVHNGSNEDSDYILQRNYYKHSSDPDFRRITFVLCKSDGTRQRAMCQYYFIDGKERPVSIKPHGNAKRAEPYFRTKVSTLGSMSSKSKNMAPKKVIDELSNEAGGSDSIHSIADMPRNRKTGVQHKKC
jgi:hypothetical protein